MSGCLFCGIVEGTVSARTVFQDEHTLAFEDINPQSPVHVLIIPKRHVTSLQEVQEADQGLLGHLVLTCTRVAAQKGLVSGYRLTVNTGRDGGQTVSHLHFHVLGGRRMTWPPG